MTENPKSKIKNPKIIAFDIGASKIAYGITDFPLSAPSIQYFDKIKTPKSKDEMIEKIIEIVEPLLSAFGGSAKGGNPSLADKGRKNIYGKIIGVGIGMAGQIDFENGKVLFSPNMPDWKNVSLKNILEKKLGLPVLIDNDARCFVLGEAKFGAAKNYQHIVGITLGTGIGGGIIINGKIYRGKNNTAGEFGHTIVENKFNLKCSCGMKGHLESYASGQAMEKSYQKLTGEELDCLEIKKRAIKKEKSALKVVNLMAEALGEGLSDVINFLNPEIIVIGGGLSKMDILWKPMIQEAKKRVFFPPLKKTKIVRSRLFEKANLLGSADLFSKNNF